MKAKTFTHGVTIYLEQGMYTRLREVCYQERQSISEVIRHLIEKGLKQKMRYREKEPESSQNMAKPV